MKDALFLAGFLALPLIGLIAWRIEAVRRMPLDGRIAVAGAAGAVITTVVLAAMSFAGISWSRARLFAILGAIAIAGVIAIGGRTSRPPGGRDVRPPNWSALALIAILALLTCYGILTARETAGDLLFFWGPKGIHFYQAHEIDVPFLANKAHPNPDYPPLLPLLYVWSQTLARSFSWWAALLTTILFFLGSVAILRASSRDDLGAALLAGVLAWTFAVTYAAGGADAPLVFFVALTLSALTFIRSDFVAAIGLAGAVLTKIEGTTFLIAVVLAIVLVDRSIKRALLVAAPALAVLAGWVAFLAKIGIVYGFGRAKEENTRIYFELIPKTLVEMAKAGSYEILGLPFLIAIALIILGRTRRAALLPLTVAVLTIGAAVFFYLHSPDPTWWIAASAPRVLLTPLTALIIASVAAWRPQSI
ncbi:MAG TPA: hypothetical protein VNA69_00300 [Thermoanaerobaculia bacterium]|nr:hypothetical protein [Thermoanaerobaculia bacterium]